MTGQISPWCEVVWVELGERRYPIVIGDGVLNQAAEWLRRVGVSDRSAHLVVTDDRVNEAGYPERVLASLRSAGISAELAVIPSGERSKSLDWAARLYETALDAGLDRRSTIWAVGGGVVGDLAGFVAATYMRGIDFVQVPTTWLAHDASVGGKTAVNLPRAKNVVGAFHQPKLVLYDPLTLDSLGPRDVASGLAEVIKHGCIRDAGFFARLEQWGGDLARLRGRDRTALLARSCAIKAGVVREDEREAGVRAHLNFGHTLGHALETAGGYERFRHGEAVAVGMVFAALLSEERLGAPAGTAARIAALLRAVGLPTAIPPDLSDDDLLRPMYSDKKTLHGDLTFVLLEAIGRAKTVRGIPESWVRRVLRRHREVMSCG